MTITTNSKSLISTSFLFYGVSREPLRRDSIVQIFHSSIFIFNTIITLQSVEGSYDYQKKQGSPTRQGTVKRGTPTRRGTGKTWFPDASGYRESWYPDASGNLVLRFPDASYLDLDQSEQQDCLLVP